MGKTRSFTKPEENAAAEMPAAEMSEDNTEAYTNFGYFVAQIAEDIPWNFVTVMEPVRVLEENKTNDTITYEFTYRIRVEAPRGEE